MNLNMNVNEVAEERFNVGSVGTDRDLCFEVSLLFC